MVKLLPPDAPKFTFVPVLVLLNLDELLPFKYKEEPPNLDCAVFIAAAPENVPTPGFDESSVKDVEPSAPSK